MEEYNTEENGVSALRVGRERERDWQGEVTERKGEELAYRNT